jgi:hypothetical protein
MSGGRLLTALLLGFLIPEFVALAQEEKTPPPQDEKPMPKEEAKPGQDKAPQHDLPGDDPGPCTGPGFEAGLRVGGWWMSGFDATIPAGRRRIDASLLVDAGVNVGMDWRGWTLTLSGDYGAARDVHVIAGSLLVGARWNYDDKVSPLSFQVSAGPLFGKLDADVEGFGEFKSALGFECRVDVMSPLTETIGIGFWLSYRQISFKFDEPVLSGDTHAGGSGFAAGLGILMRF